MDWFCLTNGEQRGPMAQDALEDLMRKGTLKPNDYVWNASFGETWRLAKDVPELNAAPVAPPVEAQPAVVYTPPVFRTPLTGVPGSRPFFSLAVAQAWAYMRQVLFKPFNLARWFSIGFCFWLAMLRMPNTNTGASFSTEEIQKLQAQAAANPSETSHILMDAYRTLFERSLSHTTAEWVFIGALTLFFLLVFGWLKAQGAFMALHRWHHPGATINQSWKVAFDGLGNSLFLFRLVVNLAGLLLTALACLGAWQHVALREIGRQLLHGGAWPMDQFWSFVIWANVVMLALAIWSTVLMLVNAFATPVMYWRRVGVMDAWRVTWEFCCRQPIPVFIYFLILPLLWIAACFVILLVCLGTCCCGGCVLMLPYLGAVMLLPVTFFFRGLGIYFLRQWRPDLEHD